MELKLTWREAGPPNHQDDKVDADQWVVNKEFSLWTRGGRVRLHFVFESDQIALLRPLICTGARRHSATYGANEGN